VINGCLTTEELQSWSGYSRPAELRRWLEKQGIRYFPGKGGMPCTTMALVNAAAGLANTVGEQPRMLGADDV
jgi:hypothetical protein